MNNIEYETGNHNDAGGYAYNYKEFVYNEETITYPPIFKHLPSMVQSLDKFKPQSGDIWLLTYPKSGTHWLYEIISILCSGELKPHTSFKGISMIETVKDISFMTKTSATSNQRIFNTHLKINLLPQKVLSESKIICVIRNPKSVAVSQFFHFTGIKDFKYDGTFSTFLQIFKNGFFSATGSWLEYTTEMWKHLRRNKSVLFVFYEDVLKNPVTEIQKIADFLHLDRSSYFCEEVAKLAKFTNMQNHIGKDKETIQSHSDMWRDQRNGFFRKGSITDWKNHFTVAENEEFDRWYSTKMEQYSDLKLSIKFQ